MKAILWRLRDELGGAGILSVAVLIAAGLAYFALVQPMQAQLAKHSRTAQGADSSASASGADKLGAFYQYMDKPEQTTDWLAKLYAIGQATGVGLQ
jgi:hypothetical protein